MFFLEFFGEKKKLERKEERKTHLFFSSTFFPSPK